MPDVRRVHEGPRGDPGSADGRCARRARALNAIERRRDAATDGATPAGVAPRTGTPTGAAAWLRRRYRAATAWTRAFAHHDDPLVEASNWVALLIGTHLPFWPLYVWWSAGSQAWPTSLATVALAPLFVVIPLLSRRSGLAGRIATPLLGNVNTVFTVWVLGASSGTVLFLAPCTALAAFLFRRRERWLMLGLATLPLVVYYALQYAAPTPLHRYDPVAAKSLFNLNVISIGVLIAAFGWLQADIYRRMERRSVDIGTAGD